ncbi:MAG: hypothetical protein KDA92_16525, partial [Planctomycetales bacterium]|nr:hypothetical protein [Planctomycetales bacterium]
MSHKRRSRRRSQHDNRLNLAQSRPFCLEQLEERQLLTVTVRDVAGGKELELSGNVDNLEDIYLQTNGEYLEYATSESGPFTALIDLSTVSAYEVNVTFKASSLDDAAQFDLNQEEDLKSTLFLKDISAPGVNLTFGAMDVEVMSGATISTRDLALGETDALAGASAGSSGNLAINGVLIDVRSGAQILAHVGGNDVVNSPGNVTISATGALDNFQSSFSTIPFVPAISTTRARALFETATIKGGDVSVRVVSDSSDLFDDGNPLGGFGEALAEFVGGLSVGAGVALSRATAELTVSGSDIAGRNVSLTSEAAADAEALVLTAYAAVAYGHSIPHATVDIRDTSTITATQDLSVHTNADSDLSIVATQNLLGTSTTAEKYNVTLAGAYSDVVSSAKLSSDSSLIVGDALSIDVDATREHNTQSNAAAYGDGTLGVALNVAVHEATLEALIDGTVVTGGDMTVDAELTTVKNDFNATSTVGTGEFGGRLQASKLGGPLRGFTSAFTSIFSGAGSAVGGNANFARDLAAIKVPNAGPLFSPETFGLSAAINVGLSFNDVDVRVGPGASVTVGGDLNLRGHVEEFPETSAISFLNSSNQYLPGAANGAYSQRETGVAGALTGGYFENHVDVYIGAGATVDVTGDMSLQSESSIPYDPQYIWDARNDAFEPGRIATFTDKFNYNLGIQNGLFSSWAEAIASAEDKAFGIMFNGLFADSHNYAYVGDGATVTVGGDLQVVADTANDTINFVGSPLIPFNATAGQGVGLAFMVTGYINDTTARINPLATIDAGSLLVFANNRGRNISIGVQGGLSDNVDGFNGAFTSSFVDNRTVSKVSPAADITLGTGLVEVPIAMETLRQDENSLFVSVPQFNPTEAYTEDDKSLVRVDVNANSITLPFDHGLETGQAVIYDNGGGTDIGGLTNGETYYAIVGEQSNVLQLALTYGNATATVSTPINLNLDTLAGVTDQSSHSLYPGFDPTAAGVVDTSTGVIDVGREHGFVSGQPVIYRDGGGSPIVGLDDGQTYYVSVTGPTAYRLAHASGDAVDAELTGDQSALISLSAGAVGRGHSLRPTNYTAVSKPNQLRVLDSNEDGRVTTADEHITSINSIAATLGSPSYQTDVNLLVISEDQTHLLSGTGAITKTLSSGAGGSVHVGVIHRETEAFIGAEERVVGNAPFAPGLGIDSSGLIVLDYDHGFSVGDK